jgi:RNA polymerase sigma factor (sigma-70 family)
MERLDSISIAALELGPAAMTLDQTISQFFEEQRDAVYFYLISIGSRAAEAEEITQEAFLRLYRELRRGGKVENPRAWVFRVAQNLAIDRWKSERYVEPMASELLEQVVDSRIDPAPNPEEKALEEERHRRLYEALLGLSVQQQRCMHLRAEGFSFAEVAEILNLSHSTVKEFVRRAVKRLRVNVQ